LGVNEYEPWHSDSAGA